MVLFQSGSLLAAQKDSRLFFLGPTFSPLCLCSLTLCAGQFPSSLAMSLLDTIHKWTVIIVLVLIEWEDISPLTEHHPTIWKFFICMIVRTQVQHAFFFTHLRLVSYLVFWAQSTTEDYIRAKTNFNLSPICSSHKSSNHKCPKKKKKSILTQICI